MIKITNKAKCCGCTLCANICPQKCITMLADNEGFLYPFVDTEKCINCSLCNKVCPSHNKSICANEQIKAYEIQINNKQALSESASGGFYTAISNYVISKNGIVFGAAYDKQFNVRHQMAECIEDCRKFRGSKYVQSDLGNCFFEVRKQLEEGRTCLFSGTPCQIYALKKFLKYDHENLITVDLVCAGVPSPKLWRKYLDMQEKQYGAPVKYANFRYKTYGYQCSTLRLEFENGKIYSKSGRIDPMMKFFVSGIAKRPSCYECSFKGIHRFSDFTLFDGWHAEQLIGKSVNNDGYTAVLVHTPKGYEVLSALQDLMQCWEVNTELATKLDGVMVNEFPKKHPCRDKFYHVLNTAGLEGCKRQFLNITIMDLFLEFLKPVLYQIGILKLVKKIRKSLFDRKDFL